MSNSSSSFSAALRPGRTIVFVALALLAMRVADGKSLIFAGLAAAATGIFVGTLGVQTNPEWISQTSGTSAVLLGAAFTDANKGYAVGTNGVIRVTTNGGSSWAAQASGTSRFLRDVYFSDATHGTIVGESGLILRTTDGTTWMPQSSGTLQHLVHVNFVNNNVGIACGQGGVILKTVDGGANWTPQNSGTGVELPGVYLLDANTAIAVGFGGTILRTTNGGASWGSVSVPGFTADLRSVHFSGGTHQLSVPIVRFNEFLPDTQEIGRGVVVGQPGAEQLLASNKQAFVNSFVQRSRFTTAYPVGMAATTFVDTLNANAGNVLSAAERDQLVADLTSGARSRAQVLRAVAEDADLVNSETNRAFVLMQYFGYLRRNPNDAPDADHTGYDFWLGKLNQFDGNFVNAEMVKAFIVSGEYKQRFGP